MTMRVTPWIRCFRDRPLATRRLLCLPHAGGAAAAFRDWPGELPPDVHHLAVQYPGRADRLAEPPIDRMDTLVDGVLAGIGAIPGPPLVLFGHSMGASVAHEVALGLERRGRPVEHLIVSGRPAPSAQRPGVVHLRGDEALLADIRRLGGTSGELLDNPESRSLILPGLRADYRLIETYRPRPGRPLTCPVTAIVGDRDTEVSLADAQAWAEVTEGDFQHVVLAGDHMSLITEPRALIRALLDRLGVPTVRALAWPSTP